MVNEGEKSRSNQAVVRQRRGDMRNLPIEGRRDGIQVCGSTHRHSSAAILHRHDSAIRPTDDFGFPFPGAIDQLHINIRPRQSHLCL